jgi:hypothetical protein
MPQSRKNHPPSLKAKVAIEAIKGHRTTACDAHNIQLRPGILFVKHAVPLTEAAIARPSHSAMAFDVYAWLANAAPRRPEQARLCHVGLSRGLQNRRAWCSIPEGRRFTGRPSEIVALV